MLWQKLLKYGINGQFLNVIKNMYSSAKSCVKKDNVLSNFFTCGVGLRQGGNLSPLLFALYLNDFENTLSKVCENFHDVYDKVNNLQNDNNFDCDVLVKLHLLRCFINCSRICKTAAKSTKRTCTV